MWVKFKQRRFQATRVNQKWAFFSFNVSWRNQINFVLQVFLLFQKRFAQIFVQNHRSREQNAVGVRHSKMLLLKLLFA